MRARLLVALVLLASGLLAGCHSLVDVRYDTTTIARVYPRAPHGRLAIATFVDRRAEDADNRALLRGDSDVVLRGKDSCVNAESHYRRGRVPAQLTQQIAAHLRARGGFASVTTSTDASADFVLEGSLAVLYGAQEYSSKPVTATVMFGLIGALATAGTKTPGETRIALRDLVLVERSSGRRQRLQDIELVQHGKLPIADGCIEIYGSVNKALRGAVASLAMEVERAASNGAAAAWAEPTAPSLAMRPRAEGSRKTFGTVVVTARLGPAEDVRRAVAVDDAEVRINGRALGTTPWQDGLPPGRYEIEVRLRSGASYVKRVVVEAGAQYAVEARFVRPLSEAERAELTAARAEAMRRARELYETQHRAWEREEARRAPARSTLLIGSVVAAIAGGAALSAGIVLLSNASATNDDVVAMTKAWRGERSSTARDPIEARIRELEKDRDREAVIGGVSIGVGSAGLITSIVLVSLRPSTEQEPSAPWGLALSPRFGTSSAGLELGGSF